MAEPAKSWIGNMLASISTSSTPRPDTDEKLVEIPNGVEKLRKAILSTQKVELELQTKEARYAQSWALAEEEYRVALEQLKLEQDDVALRLAKLRTEWVTISKDLGVAAGLPISTKATGDEP